MKLRDEDAEELSPESKKYLAPTESHLYSADNTTALIQNMKFNKDSMIDDSRLLSESDRQ